MKNSTQMALFGFTAPMWAKIPQDKSPAKPFLLVPLIIFLAIVSVDLAANPAHLTLVDEWSGVFAGEKSSFNVLVNSERELNGILSWRLHAHGRTIFRQQKRISVKPGNEKYFSVSIHPPEINDGVILDVTLQIDLTEDGAEKPVARIKRTVRLFNKDPFVQKKNELIATGIALFDPVGKTAAVFESANIPFIRVQGLDSINGFTGRVLIVGEGTPISNYRGLANMLLQLASSGVPVLCLAPSSGEFPLNAFLHKPLEQPNTLLLKRQDVIGDLDTKLDFLSWPPNGKVVATSLQLVTDKNGVAGKVSVNDTGWVWMEIDFGPNKGKFVFAGFAIIEKWNTGPVPRFLLDKLLNHIQHLNFK